MLKSLCRTSFVRVPAIRFVSAALPSETVGTTTGRSPKRSRWPLIKTALLCYKQLHGNLEVKHQFVVPDDEPWPKEVRGLKLGITLTSIRCKGTYEDYAADLKDLGFVFDKRGWTDLDSKEWPLVKETLKIFKETHGSLTVPYLFVVPSSHPWPERMWGAWLGQISLRIRNSGRFKLHRVELEAMGFPFARQRPGTDDAFNALMIYKQQRGNFIIGDEFVVPHQLPWPVPLWGRGLGKILHDIRSGVHFKELKPKLIAEGLDFVEYRQHDFNVTITALKTFKKIYQLGFEKLYDGPRTGKYRTFRVPDCDPNWPADTWGLELSRKARYLHLGYSYFDPKSRAKLQEIGFEVKEILYPRFLAALKAYIAVNGGLEAVTNETEISDADARYPEEIRSLRQDVRLVGRMLYSIRVTGRFSDKKAELEALGVDFRPRRGDPELSISALKVYKEVYGDIDVPRTFTVPAGPPWPTEAVGLQLRPILDGILLGKYNKGYKSEVKAMCGDLRIPRKRGERPIK